MNVPRPQFLAAPARRDDGAAAEAGIAHRHGGAGLDGTSGHHCPGEADRAPVDHPATRHRDAEAGTGATPSNSAAGRLVLSDLHHGQGLRGWLHPREQALLRQPRARLRRVGLG
jgi:hypothetical protein